MATVTRTIELTEAICITCDASYALPKAVMDRHREHGGYHWCPVCGTSQGWDPKAIVKRQEENAEIERLKKNLKWEQDFASEQRRGREEAERRLSATKGVVTKLKQRAAGGMCPCCNRSFVGLARHMATKHPEFKNEA